MLHALLTLRVDKAPFLISVTVMAAIGLIAMLAGHYSSRSAQIAAAAGLGGVLLGTIVGWLTSDVWNTFGVALTVVTKAWMAAAFGGLAIVVWAIATRPWWRRVVAVVCIPLFVLTTAAWINIDFGAYRNVDDALGITPYPVAHPGKVSRSSHVEDPRLGIDWKPPANMPKHGKIEVVTIPGTVSHFVARPAIVYLPPAAQVSHAPVLPVIEMFAGQPGSPNDMVGTGQVGDFLDRYAAVHKGLAPIVVVADQLGRPDSNPMCVDSPIGKSASYLTKDTPNWIRSHLKVSFSRSDWVVAGFSQGGTCAIQLGAGYPAIFGAILDISGEVAPTIGAGTLTRAFGGSAAAYERATPLYLLRRNAPFDSWAVFGYGTADTRYGRGMREVAAAAKAAGMTTTIITAAGSGHDWNTARTVLSKALPLLSNHLGLGNG